MAISRLYDFVTGTTIEPDEVDGELNQIVNAGMALISPADATLDMNGNGITGLAAGTVSAPGLAFTSDPNTGLYHSAADTVDVTAGGVRAARFNTATTGVNFLDVTPSAAGSPILIEAEGTDDDIDITIEPKGEGICNLAPAGLIAPYAGTTAPTGWLLCDGAAVSRTTYARLFAVVSTTFGVGDGSTTFNVPDLRGRFPLGLDNLGGSSANRVTEADADTLGGSGGSETIAEANLPSHTHDLGNHTHTIAHTHTITHGHAADAGATQPHTITIDADLNEVAQTDLSTNASSAADSGAPSSNTSGATGSGTAYTPPYLALGYIIKH